MSLSRGDVVLISFPFTDLTSVKVRPALVLSDKGYNTGGEDVIVSLVTSSIVRPSLFSFRIDLAHPDFPKSGFKVPSAIIADKIHTLHHSLIKRRLGFVSASTVKQVQDMVRHILFN